MACWLSADGRDESVGFMDPFAERYDGVNVYRFYFGPYIAYIKADQRPFTEPLSQAALGAKPLLTIIRREHRGSKDFAAMVRTARAQHQNSLRAKQMGAERHGTSPASDEGLSNSWRLQRKSNRVNHTTPAFSPCDSPRQPLAHQQLASPWIAT